ncbi:MAG TPA: flavin reductase family protein [Acidimicrobiales bacterium]|nr:flavin reductase family protein [Acidimicrobiales bacterium]
MAGGQVVGPVPPGRDPDAYDRLRRRLLWALPTGLYVLGSRAGTRRNLMTISWVTQVAVDPKLVAVSIESASVTRELVDEGGAFALTVLPREERALVRRFVKPADRVEVDDEGRGTIQGEPVVAAPSGVPVLAAAAIWFDCRVAERMALGSHVLYAGQVVDCGLGAPGTAGDGDDTGGRATDDGAGAGDILRMEDTRMNYGG